MIRQSSRNKFGQYFTPAIVAEFMIDLADISPDSRILEPSCGEGVFLELLQRKGFHNLAAFEIDGSLSQKFDFVRYESFVSAKIDEKFDLVIGNPPYIRWKNLEEKLKSELTHHPLWNRYFNALCDYSSIFIIKSIELLNEDGQLIFICPEYWLSTTHSLSLRNYMTQHGHFEEIYHFNETPIFDKVMISTVVFKFVKNKATQKKINIIKFHTSKKLTQQTLHNLKDKISTEGVTYTRTSQFRANERWLLESDEKKGELRLLEKVCQKKEHNSSITLFNSNISYHTVGQICDIGNGMVSGLDKAFQINGYALNEDEKLVCIEVIKAKDLKPFFAEKTTPYVLIRDDFQEDEFKEKYPNFYIHFQRYKSKLEKRYQYNRRINYWEWVFLRNFKLFSQPEKRIFVPCKERISHKSYFRFALVAPGIFPTQDVTAIFRKADTKESIEYILAYLNQSFVFDWLKCNGIVKGSIVEFSEKPIASIPFRKINWGSQKEVNIHDTITHLTQTFITNKNKALLTNINDLFTQLFNMSRYEC
ncbi:MAG: Eco57I restriction-modification methylase domain-containing protein [Bernardetiaceae bacterium]